jgi:hypothetical protein
MHAADQVFGYVPEDIIHVVYSGNTGRKIITDLLEFKLVFVFFDNKLLYPGILPLFFPDLIYSRPVYKDDQADNKCRQ